MALGATGAPFIVGGGAAKLAASGDGGAHQEICRIRDKLEAVRHQLENFQRQYRDELMLLRNDFLCCVENAQLSLQNVVLNPEDLGQVIGKVDTAIAKLNEALRVLLRTERIRLLSD